MKIREMPVQNRPRERMLKLGAGVLSDSELFAIILRTGTKNENVIDMSNRLISEYGTGKIFDCSADIYNCDNFVKCSDVLRVFNECNNMTGNDIHQLDVGSDGIPCENLC